MRLLILGGGAVVTEYYLPALRALGWLEDAVVVDPSRRALESLHAVAPSLRVDAIGFDAALADPSVGDRFDAAIIALPNALHERAVATALHRGLNVLCEKPLAMTRDACCSLADLARTANRTLAVGMVRRLVPSFELLQAALRRKLIGDLVRIEIQDGEPYAWLSDSGAFFRPENGGVLADMGVHYLDWLQEICGPLTPLAYSDDWRGGVEANAELELKNGAGLTARLKLSRTRRLRNEMVCYGTAGTLSLRKDELDRCAWQTADGETLLVRDEPGADQLESAFVRELVEFGGSIERGTPPRVPAEEATKTVDVIEWAYAHHTDRHPRSRGAADAPSGAGPKRDDTAMPDGKVFVTGGTGFIGSHLIQRLAETPQNAIVAPVRSYRTCAEIARYPVDMPRLDLLDPASVRQAIRGSRYVFHLAYGRDEADAERVTVQGTRTVVEAAIAERCQAVVILSTIYVFGRPDGAVNESWPYSPIGGTYGRTKAQMERWCLERSATSGETRMVVLNPGCVYGPRGGAYTEMPVQMARDGGFCWIDQGQGTMNYAYVDNVVDAIFAAATCPEAHGQRFIVCDGATTWRSFFEELFGPELARSVPSYTPRELHEIHATRPRPSVADVARLIVRNQEVRTAVRESRAGELALKTVDRVAPRLLQGVRAQPRRNGVHAASEPMGAPLPPEWLADLYAPSRSVYVADKARRVLGWSPRVDLVDGLARTRRWLVENGLADSATCSAVS
ncbi:MAG: NAD-dependent epimerase/dehydratase family protein [Chloroflexi bacterium]|nr:NAD-dependent epimerase/dehydratase family protein [Chloroflexota bacterium]